MRASWLSSSLCLVASSFLFVACGGTPNVATQEQEASGGTSSGTQKTGAGGGPTLDNDTGGSSSQSSGTKTAAGGAEQTDYCGNSELDENEGCDDGNATPGDGCDGTCKVEPGYECARVGEACTTTLVCGDGAAGPDESCDDGNTEDGDGCSSTCAVEQGYSCSGWGAGSCTETADPAVCGNGATEYGETCDDGNTEPDDGCSATCQTEAGYTCSGTTCTKNETCGDGVLNTGEQCDDGNQIPSDCCSATCQLESYCECVTPTDDSTDTAQICSSTIVCGDGTVMPGEECDDGDTASGDGCDEYCHLEEGYNCPAAGGECTEAEVLCPNSAIDAGEGCDDGNSTSGDGCSKSCKLEDGYSCPTAGQPCVLKEYCGNGHVAYALGERCDDGNDVDDDGCTNCTIDENHSCDNSKEPSVCQDEYCGNGRITLGETCDDGNASAGDGCSDICKLEEGFRCPVIGSECIAICGDALVVGKEECDDGGKTSGDGCNSACRVEPGYDCTTGTCIPSECNNGDKESGEGCDDGNLVAGDGCGPTCQIEPQITRGTDPTVTITCGDGLIMSGEDCDDGNTTDGDGCSASCKFEAGYQCEELLELPEYVDFQVTYRDFKSARLSGGHPDFQYDYGQHNEGIVGDLCTTSNADTCGRLDSLGKPALIDNTQSKTWIHSADTFAIWYADDEDATSDADYNGNPKSVTGFNGVIQTWRFTKTLRLTQDGTDEETYVFDSNGDKFYPLSGTEGSGDLATEGSLYTNHGTTYIMNYVSPTKETYDSDYDGRNYGFTTEFRYFFQYRGGETLKFTGDDDVWVFINGRLAVDLGGLHSALSDQVVLTSASGEDPASDPRFGLEAGGVYEIAFFHAERHTTASYFKLTLTGFLAPRSYCTADCGDGIVAGAEECDDPNGNDGTYGGCKSDCTLASYCGDGTPDVGTADAPGPETCDLGVNVDVYGVKGGCTPACQLTPYCGDGSTDLTFGETCDLGAEHNTAGAYGPNTCTDKCQIGPFCGDGVINGSELCDDGESNGSSSSTCEATCVPKCGNGNIDADEQCDNGSENGVAYNGCDAECRLSPYCGDGIKDSAFGETCDNGQNDGSYGTCTSNCQLASYCGDGKEDTESGEECDLGGNNELSPYGKNSDGSVKCTTTCQTAPYCGDHAVNSSNGEKCDDGANNSNTVAGACKTDCSGYNAPPSTCGNGSIDDGEECDEGSKNGTSASLCDGRCQYKCGNGIKDSGEQCDDGINDGSYGTCSSTCTLTAYCGDSTKNGPEECDLGDDNEANPYGKNADGTYKCTSACKIGPYCGDGLVSDSEECDGQTGCLSTCEWDDDSGPLQ